LTQALWPRDSSLKTLTTISSNVPAQSAADTAEAKSTPSTKQDTSVSLQQYLRLPVRERPVSLRRYATISSLNFYTSMAGNLQDPTRG
jgi:hypothetical protein